VLQNFTINANLRSIYHPERRDYDVVKMGFKTGAGKNVKPVLNMSECIYIYTIIYENKMAGKGQITSKRASS
jgi:hypothetical protein